MTDYDSIWRTQDEIRTVVNAVLGECIWNLSYSERRIAIELELTVTLDDDAISNLCCQFPTASFLSLPIMMVWAQEVQKLYSPSQTKVKCVNFYLLFYAFQSPQSTFLPFNV